VAINLALGIAAFTGIFGVVHSVVVEPLPYPAPERLMLVEHAMPGITAQGQPTVFGGFQGQVLHYAERSQLIEEIGFYSPYDAAIESANGPDYVRAGVASAGFFRALGSPIEYGRLSGSEEAAIQRDAGDTLLLGSGYWRQREGADPGVVGTIRRVDGADVEVIGVLRRQGPFPSQRLSVWVPRSESQIRSAPQLLVHAMIVRVASGVDAAMLRRELDALIAELPGQIDDPFVRRAVGEGQLQSRVTPLAGYVVGPVEDSLWLLLGAAALVLLAALGNVTGLQLLRREAQRREVAVRHALGASRLALVRQHAGELAALCALGTAAGIVAAIALVRWLRSAGPEDLPRLGELHVAPTTVAVALGVGLATWVWLVGVRSLSPAAPGRALRGAAGADRSGRAWVRDMVAAGELAVAVLLLVGAGLVLRSYMALNGVDPGFNADRVLAFRVPFPAQEIQNAGGLGVATPFYDALAERLRGAPGVEAVGYSQCSPFGRSCGPAGLTLRPVEEPPDAGTEARLTFVVQASPGYLETLRIPLLAGRHLEAADHEDTTNAAILSASTAAALWPDEAAIGRQVATPDLPHFTPLTVVGVVADARHSSLRGAAEPTVYLPVLLAEQEYELPAVSFVVRSTVPPLSVVNGVRTILARFRPDIPAANIETLASALGESTSQLRLAMAILAATAAAVLLLAATGVYGVIAYAVSLRGPEFGIRLALGADAANLRSLVARHAAVIAALGLGAGGIGSILGSRALRSVLFGVAPTDPLTYMAVALLLGFTAACACYLPARRATRTDPAAVLRTE
jgi:predicted permease